MANKYIHRSAENTAPGELFVTDSCYASANIKFLEILGYAEHICNYVVILDSWFYGKVSEI